MPLWHTPKVVVSHLIVGVVRGVVGVLSRLEWTGLCAGAMLGLRAGSLREKRETARCTVRERRPSQVC